MTTSPNTIYSILVKVIKGIDLFSLQTDFAKPPTIVRGNTVTIMPTERDAAGEGISIKCSTDQQLQLSDNIVQSPAGTWVSTLLKFLLFIFRFFFDFYFIFLI